MSNRVFAATSRAWSKLVPYLTWIWHPITVVVLSLVLLCGPFAIAWVRLIIWLVTPQSPVVPSLGNVGMAILQYLLWPAVVLTVAFLFKRQLIALVARILKIITPAGTIEFAEAQEIVHGTVQTKVDSTPDERKNESDDTTSEYLQELLDMPALQAIRVEWGKLNNLLLNRLKKHKHNPLAPTQSTQVLVDVGDIAQGKKSHIDAMFHLVQRALNMKPDVPAVSPDAFPMIIGGLYRTRRELEEHFAKRDASANNASSAK